MATVLGTTADRLILPDGEDDLTDYVEGKIAVEDSKVNPLDSHGVTALLNQLQNEVGTKYKILLMYVGTGSVILYIRLHVSDIARIMKAFRRGRLDHFHIISITCRVTAEEYLPPFGSFEIPSTDRIPVLPSEQPRPTADKTVREWAASANEPEQKPIDPRMQIPPSAAGIQPAKKDPPSTGTPLGKKDVKQQPSDN